jgi:hypothetical protein
MLSIPRPVHAGPLQRRRWLLSPVGAAILVIALAALGHPGRATAQQGDPGAAIWRDALRAAPVTPGEADIFQFFSVILVPPASPNQFSSATVDSAGSSDDGTSYDIMLTLPNGRAELHGALGRDEYDQAVAAAPPGCRTANGRARGYCFFNGPHYEYFPGLSVAGHPAIAVYGGFETNFGALVGLTWYDADTSISYSLTIYGMDAAAQAGFSGGNAADHVRPAAALAALASQFLGI